MKWKITFRYVLSVAAVTVIILILNIILGLIIFNSIKHDSNQTINEYVNNPEKMTRNFEKYLINKSNDINKIYINDEGKNVLDEEKLWIQILDEEGKEIYNYKKPNEVKTKHTPFELIHGYKYSGGIDKGSTIFFANKKMNNYEYSYIIGFPMYAVSKTIITYTTSFISKFIINIIGAFIIIDSIIAILIGYLFSKTLTRPIKRIIDGVDDLSEGRYENYYKENGVYKPVFGKLNSLSETLKDNEVERKKLDSMRNEWIANVSHDIKTPLASIKGYSELISEDYDLSNEEIKKYSQIINNKSVYIKELVDDLNLTMKLKNGYTNIEKKSKNIVNIVKNCVIDILNEPKYENIEINFECENDEVFRNVDEMLIKRVINNLLYNAIIHNNNKVKIDVKIKVNISCKIIIEDFGKGIAKEDLKYIFDRYYRGTNTGEAHKGSGLGMAIARDVIIAHNGDINIYSKLGEGTRIEIII